MKQLLDLIIKLITYIFSNDSTQTIIKQTIKEQPPMPEEPKKQYKIYITLADYAMGRDKTFHSEWINTIIDNANVLLKRVNDLLNDVQLQDSYKVSSGWRPAMINAAVTNAAKRSNHMRGKAVDIIDTKDQKLANYLLANLDKLEKYGLWLESPKYTIGKNTNWIHLQSEPPASGNRVFIP
jgi:hypothetical protein